MNTKLRRKLPNKLIVFIVFAVFFGLLILAYSVLGAGLAAVDGAGFWSPDYEQTDISQILEKEQLTEEDYNILYMQTGLTKLGVDRCLAKGASGIKRIKTIQKNYFAEHSVVSNYVSPLICEDVLEENVSCAYFETGDVFVTSATHIGFWKMGHAGLAVDSTHILQANAYGTITSLGSSSDFSSRPSFMIFSVKTDNETKEQVADFAKNNLVGLKYSALMGIFRSKNSIAFTQCAHLVWYAYRQYGVDLDSNGGGLVVPQDLANSPEVELVQVFGIDPFSLWT